MGQQKETLTLHAESAPSQLNDIILGKAKLEQQATSKKRKEKRFIRILIWHFIWCRCQSLIRAICEQDKCPMKDMQMQSKRPMEEKTGTDTETETETVT